MKLTVEDKRKKINQKKKRKKKVGIVTGLQSPGCEKGKGREARGAVMADDLVGTVSETVRV